MVVAYLSDIAGYQHTGNEYVRIRLMHVAIIHEIDHDEHNMCFSRWKVIKLYKNELCQEDYTHYVSRGNNGQTCKAGNYCLFYLKINFMFCVKHMC